MRHRVVEDAREENWREDSEGETPQEPKNLPPEPKNNPLRRHFVFPSTGENPTASISNRSDSESEKDDDSDNESQSGGTREENQTSFAETESEPPSEKRVSVLI